MSHRLNITIKSENGEVQEIECDNFVGTASDGDSIYQIARLDAGITETKAIENGLRELASEIQKIIVENAMENGILDMIENGVDLFGEK